MDFTDGVNHVLRTDLSTGQPLSPSECIAKCAENKNSVCGIGDHGLVCMGDTFPGEYWNRRGRVGDENCNSPCALPEGPMQKSPMRCGGDINGVTTLSLYLVGIGGDSFNYLGKISDMPKAAIFFDPPTTEKNTGMYLFVFYNAINRSICQGCYYSERNGVSAIDNYYFSANYTLMVNASPDNCLATCAFNNVELCGIEFGGRYCYGFPSTKDINQQLSSRKVANDQCNSPCSVNSSITSVCGGLNQDGYKFSLFDFGKLINFESIICLCIFQGFTAGAAVINLPLVTIPFKEYSSTTVSISSPSSTISTSKKATPTSLRDVSAVSPAGGVALIANVNDNSTNIAIAVALSVSFTVALIFAILVICRRRRQKKNSITISTEIFETSVNKPADIEKVYVNNPESDENTLRNSGTSFYGIESLRSFSRLSISISDFFHPPDDAPEMPQRSTKFPYGLEPNSAKIASIVPPRTPVFSRGRLQLETLRSLTPSPIIAAANTSRIKTPRLDNRSVPQTPQINTIARTISLKPTSPSRYSPRPSRNSSRTTTPRSSLDSELLVNSTLARKFLKQFNDLDSEVGSEIDSITSAPSTTITVGFGALNPRVSSMNSPLRGLVSNASRMSINSPIRDRVSSDRVSNASQMSLFMNLSQADQLNTSDDKTPPTETALMKALSE
ncbi:hypothetical protein HK096_004637, partial [Nowakowskiella sp. JEL0078]